MKTFDALENWMREVGKHAGDNAGKIKTFVVGLKLDKASVNR